jgi:hypothetical protein
VNAQKVVGSLAEAGIPGAFLVDTLPFREWVQYVLLVWIFKRLPVKYVPSWFPGASFKRKAKGWKALLPDFVDKPFENVKAALVRSIPVSMPKQ